jgi:hypothetical protein
VLDDTGVDAIVARTDGVTAAFLKELLRKAALLAAEADAAADADGSSPIRVTDGQLEAALDQLLAGRSALTRVLLGGQAAPTAGQAAAGQVTKGD